MKKNTGIFFLQVAIMNAVFAANPERPKNVSKDAVYQPATKVWVSEKKIQELYVYEQWKANGVAVTKEIKYSSLIKKYGFANNQLWSKEQCRLMTEPGDGPNQSIEVEKKYGKITFFSEHLKISGEMCYAILPLKEKDKDINLRMKGNESYPCGESWELVDNGSKISRERYTDKCLQGCGEFKPFMPPGKYKVHATNVVFRDKPSTKGKSLGTILKDTALQVIEDTHKIETHDFETAPWVKVKHDGKVGYVFGGFLDSLERNDL